MRTCVLACDDRRVTNSGSTAAPAAGPTSAPGNVEPRRLMRVSHDRQLAGVARGLSEHLGVDVLIVRLLFVVLAFANGAGFLMYAAFWIFAPLQVSGTLVPTVM